MKMEMRDIEYFAAVAGHGNVGRAAEQLGMSQPALSKSLRRLEAAVGTKLVKRTPKGVDLTAVGAALFARARGLRLSLDDIAREAAELGRGEAGHLRIGAAASSALHLVPLACDRLLKVSPKVTFNLVVGDHNTLLSGARNGTLDVIITAVPSPQHVDLVEEKLYDEQYVVYASANHRLAKRQQLMLTDLVQERWAMGTINGSSERRLSQAFADSGLPPPSIAMVTPFLPARYHLVGTSDLLGFGTRQQMWYAAARFRIAELRIQNLALTLHVGVAHRKDAYLPPAALRFIEILKSTAKEIAKDNR